MNIPILHAHISRPTTTFCDPSEFTRVAREVSDSFGLSTLELLSTTRQRRISHPRQIAQYLLVEMGQRPRLVGAYFNCTEANVSASKYAVRDRVSVDAKEREQVIELRRRLAI